MFKQRQPSLALRWLYYLLLLMVTWRLVQTLFAPFLGSDLAFSFRSDSFFSFSGGQFRRGLIGEFLYQMQLLGLPAVFIYSLLLLLLFAILYAWLFPKLLASFRPNEVLLIILSGFFLMPGIDREIFMLLPAVYYFLRRQLDFGFFAILFILAFIHEMSLLLYFPFIWAAFRQMQRERKWARLLYVLPVLMAYVAAIVLKGNPNYIPEREFWPQFGINDLEEHFLYSFAGKGLLATLKLHASVFLGKVQSVYALPGLISFFGILYLLLRRFGASVYSMAYYLAVTLLFFMLTIDYGRYFYLLFFFYLLVGQGGLLAKADDALADFKFLIPKFSQPWLSHDFSHVHFQILLLIFALAPFGYWLGDTQLSFAFMQEVQQFIHFELPKYAGE